MKKLLSLFFIIALAGCSTIGGQVGSKSNTGLGTSPFSAGGPFTKDDANAMNDAINDNDERLDTLEALTGPVFSDGDGTYTDISSISSAELLDLGTDGTPQFASVTPYADADNNVSVHGDGYIEISDDAGGARIDFKDAGADDFDARITQNNADGLAFHTGGNGSTAVALTLDSSQNAVIANGNIELGHATDTTIARASAGELTVEGVAVYLTGDEDTIAAAISTGNINTTGEITGKIKIDTDSDGYSVTGAMLYGGVLIESGNQQTVTLGAVAAGMSFCVIADGADGSAEVYLDCDASDHFEYDGTTMSDGEYIYNDSDLKGDRMCVLGIDGSTWLVTYGGDTTVAEETP